MTRCFLLSGLVFLATLHAGEKTIPTLTAPPNGPYHVRGNRIVDSAGREYLVRGTQFPVITPDGTTNSKNEAEFGIFSGTSFVTIRQRMNMNAVRLKVNAAEYETAESYRTRIGDVVGLANQFELLAILEPEFRSPASSAAIDNFWARCAARFKTNPNVFFALTPVEDSERVVEQIRLAGASQPIIVTADSAAIRDPNIIYQISPSYTTIKADLARLGNISDRVPVMANGLDPHLGRTGGECAAFPADPADATRLLEDVLNYFDQHAVSWTISTLEPGKLVDNFEAYNWRKLDDGWTCGESPVHSGIAMVLLSHLWRANPHGIFTVNQPAGGLVVARGGNSSSYGRTLAEREARPEDQQPLQNLGDISVQVTDSRGEVRLAPLSWVGGGWSNINFVIPADSAPGPAEVVVLRSDGSKTSSTVIVANVAPAFWSATHDGRGPVIGQVVQHFADGRTAQFPAWGCSKDGCHSVPIPLTSRASTTVRLEGTGFRYASSKAGLRVSIDGIPVPVEDFGPLPNGSRDQITIRLPDEFIGHGEGELLLVADGALSNVVRINLGRQR